MKLLKFSLFFNSLFSLGTGIALAIQSNTISQLFGVQESWFFIALGIGLILFSIAVFYIGRQSPIHPLPSLIIICLDLTWVLASIALLILDPIELTETGQILVGVVALIVLVISVMQSAGLSKVDSNKNTGYKELKFERIINANSQIVWSVISDIANYHHVAPNIDDVKIISGNGEGMVRQCSQGKSSWTEDCVKWNDGEEFSFKVNTDDPKYPFPLSFLQGTWKVAPVNTSESKIEMVFEFQYKRKAFNVFLHPLMAPKFRSIAEELLDNWEKKLTSEV